jgi:hypothetical protein
MTTAKERFNRKFLVEGKDDQLRVGDPFAEGSPILIANLFYKIIVPLVPIVPNVPKVFRVGGQ